MKYNLNSSPKEEGWKSGDFFESEYGQARLIVCINNIYSGRSYAVLSLETHNVYHAKDSYITVDALMKNQYPNAKKLELTNELQLELA